MIFFFVLWQCWWPGILPTNLSWICQYSGVSNYLNQHERHLKKKKMKISRESTFKLVYTISRAWKIGYWYNEPPTETSHTLSWILSFTILLTRNISKSCLPLLCTDTMCIYGHLCVEILYLQHSYPLMHTLHVS